MRTPKGRRGMSGDIASGSAKSIPDAPCIGKGTAVPRNRVGRCAKVISRKPAA